MVAKIVTLELSLAGLGLCIFIGIQVLYALLFGPACFSLYTLSRGYFVRETYSILGEGMEKVKNILIIFVLIGSLISIWRTCGTIPFILYHAIGLIDPRFFVLCTFLLCPMTSFLTGTLFGTASTMSVICMLISNAAGLDPALTGGAVLSGSFFENRCSPISSSAQLVYIPTRTDIYTNLKNMYRTCPIPLFTSCILYVALAGRETGAQVSSDLLALFRDNFSLHPATALPAFIILGLALFRVDVKYAMGASIVAITVVAVLYQGAMPADLMKSLRTGYRAESKTRSSSLLNGGDISSMVEVGIIVLISSSYPSIFSRTRLLVGVKSALQRPAGISTPFGTVVVTSVPPCAVSCNQSLATILTCQMCGTLYPSKEKLALALEDTVIVLAALVPRGIAGAVPTATAGAPMVCMLYAFYLHLLPMRGSLTAFYHERPKASVPVSHS